MLHSAQLPDNIDALKALLSVKYAELAAFEQECGRWKFEREALRQEKQDDKQEIIRLTMSEAEKLLGVTHYMIRRLINDRVLPAEQVMPDASWQIHASDLRSNAVMAALTRKHRPCRHNVEGQLPMFTEVSEGGAQ
ncbi:helix-turn-helix domain-containing protein [Paralcaligenes ureilyticus]|uniref:Excisionase family DNA binding protein n=1 Tax=Paralcaligenes ureilyticus TaxID=627131 RepID=A0A4R3MBH7_9BURK|nr:helix-turn-helix domain-containing protein [Paralcaligenes ureilyticus]TCT09609.1 hypothetical protein EDC26_103228 [Paralcaligenes ureilyticus]